jgi:hypothetical protein
MNDALSGPTEPQSCCSICGCTCGACGSMHLSGVHDKDCRDRAMDRLIAATRGATCGKCGSAHEGLTCEEVGE